MDKILVTYASKYGSTAEIAERIGETLKKSGYDVDVRQVKTVDGLDSYGTVIIGSAIYIGQWRKAIKLFMQKNEQALSEKKTWFFSSGPTGDGEPTKLTDGWEYPESFQPLFDKIQPIGITLFHGKVAMERLNFIERFMAKKVESPIGDYRDWETIGKWANSIADHLKK